MKTALNISPDLRLPLDLITETAAIIAKRGVGKTYTASVITEELLKAGGHVIAIDPVGVWWGFFPCWRFLAHYSQQTFQPCCAGGNPMATMTEAPPATLTYEAYMVEPEVQGRYNVVEGVRVFQPELSWDRQRIIGNLSSGLFAYERATGGYIVPSAFDLLVRRSPLQIRQPDLLFIGGARLTESGGPPKVGPLEIGPELVVEIVWGSGTQRILEDKIANYIHIGVDECWVVRPDARTVEMLALTPGGARTVATYGEAQAVASVVFPGLSVPVAEVFAP